MNHSSMRDWRWWTEEPRRAVAGFLLLSAFAYVLYIVITKILLPLILGAMVVVALLWVIRFALTGNSGGHGGK